MMLNGTHTAETSVQVIWPGAIIIVPDVRHNELVVEPKVKAIVQSSIAPPPLPAPLHCKSILTKSAAGPNPQSDGRLRQLTK